MKLILCTDIRFGYSFNYRRQTADRAMHAHLSRILAKSSLPVHMNAYTSRSLLANEALLEESFLKKIVIDDSRKEGYILSDETFFDSAFLLEACRNKEWAYVENVSLIGYYHLIDEILLYRWDKRYPADRLFPGSLLSAFSLAEKETFRGNSHDEIEFLHYKKISLPSDVPPGGLL